MTSATVATPASPDRTTIETRVSWNSMLDRTRHCRRVVRGAGDHRRRAQIDCRRSRRRALGAGAGVFAGLARRLLRRRRDGARGRAVRRAPDGDLRVADDCRGAGAGAERQYPRPARRLRGVYRSSRQCGDECAALYLCLPLVRPASRHGAGAARQRLVGIGGGLGADLRRGGAQFGWRATMLSSLRSRWR